VISTLYHDLSTKKPKAMTRQKNSLFIGFSTATAFACCLLLYACRKDKAPVPGSTDFNAAAAKEWYYANFRKSGEWASSPLKGKKLPDWKSGIFKKVGNLEIVEFPLVSQKKLVPISSSLQLTDDEKKLVTASTKEVISFIRKGKDVFVRETSFVPDLSFLRSSGFDLGRVSLLNEKQSFTGKVIIRNWKGDVLSMKKTEEGKVTKVIRIKPKNADPKKLASRSTCDDTYECLFAYVCEVWTYPDGMESIKECEWVNTGECWPAGECPPEGTDDPCLGLSSEQCACTTYGICPGGETEPEDECANYECPSGLVSNSASEPAGHSVTFSGIVNGLQTEKENYKWIYNYSYLLGYNWHYYSHESVEKVFTGGQWRFVSITHVDKSMMGTLPPCMSESSKINNWNVNFSNMNRNALITLEWSLKVTVTCCKICPDMPDQGTSTSLIRL